MSWPTYFETLPSVVDRQQCARHRRWRSWDWRLRSRRSLLGELVPKRLALHRAEQLARFVAPLMTVLSRIARPIVWLMSSATNAVLMLANSEAKSEPSVSVDDIEHLIDTGTAEGVVEPLEKRVAVEALRLGERTVRDIMRPRIDLDALDVDTPADEVLGTVAMAGFSRLPVYEGDLDHIIGFVHIKDLFLQQYLGWPIELRKLLHPALFVPETMPLDRLLELFQEKHNQLAIVLDEYGGTEGMVTLEDVLEEIVGEIRDEHRREKTDLFVQRDDNTWLIDGMVSVSDLIERLEIRHAEGVEPPRLQHDLRPDPRPTRPHPVDRRCNRLERAAPGSRRHGRPTDRSDSGDGRTNETNKTGE